MDYRSDRRSSSTALDNSVPLLDDDHMMGQLQSAPTPKQVYQFSTWALCSLTVLIVLLFAIATFVLPLYGGPMDNTDRIAAIHAGVFVVVGLLHFGVTRHRQKLVKSGFFTFWSSTRIYANASMFIVVVTNAVLLVLCGIRDSASTTKATSTVHELSLQIVGCVEAALVLFFTALYLKHTRSYDRRQTMPDAIISSAKHMSLNAAAGARAGAISATPYSLLRSPHAEASSHELRQLVQQLQHALQTSFQAGGGSDSSVAALQHSMADTQREIRTLQQENMELRTTIRGFDEAIAAEKHNYGQALVEIRNLNDQIDQLESELTNAREESKRTNMRLEIELEANAQAQRALNTIRTLDISDLSDSGIDDSSYLAHSQMSGHGGGSPYGHSSRRDDGYTPPHTDF